MIPEKPEPPQVKYVRDGGLREYVKAEMEARQTPVLDACLYYFTLGLVCLFMPLAAVLLGPFMLLGWLASFWIGGPDELDKPAMKRPPKPRPSPPPPSPRKE